MNRSAKDGAWSSPHYGDEGAWVPLRRSAVSPSRVPRSRQPPRHRDGFFGESATARADPRPGRSEFGCSKQVRREGRYDGSLNYAFEDDEVQSVAQKNGQWQVHRLPVLDSEKQLVGIVSLGDLALDGKDRKARRRQ